MEQPKLRLNDFARDEYSQFGEDGIIDKLFQLIGTQTKLCIEFGAWEGYFDSNTANLWTKGWHGVLIEGDTKRFERLEENIKPNDCICINAYVQAQGHNSLESLLSKHNISERPDLLSIDIDGNDYYIFEGLSTLKPRVIICEYNPTIPKHVALLATPDNHFGCSIKVVTELANKKGYTLVATTDTNAIFVDNDELTKLSDVELAYDQVAQDKHVSYFIADYDGNYAVVGPASYGVRKPLQQAFQIGAAHWPDKINRWRQIAKRVRRSDLIEALIEQAHYQVWKMNGKKTAPPHLYKQKRLKDLAKKYQLDTFVETGTYLGKTVEAMLPHFKKIISIEVEPNLYRRALKKFVNAHHLNLKFGDSGKILNEIVPGLKAPALFWLDGHYSAGITGKGELNTPISNELTAIFNSPFKHTIVIDDARCFDGTHDYPRLEDLRAMITKDHPDYAFEVENDAIILTPKAQ